MKHEKKRYVVHIFGDEYTLVSDELEEQVAASVNKVNEAMGSIAGKFSTVEPKKAAVLAAVRMASELLRAQLVIEDDERKKESLIQQIDHELFSS